MFMTEGLPQFKNNINAAEEYKLDHAEFALSTNQPALTQIKNYHWRTYLKEKPESLVWEARAAEVNRKLEEGIHIPL